MKYFFAEGNEMLNSPVVEGDVVTLPCSDDYDHLHLKTREMLKYALSRYSFSHMMKCDDDTYVVLDRALSLASRATFLSDIHLTASGGAGYIMSKEAVEVLVKKMNANFTFPSKTAEDVMVTKILWEAGIEKENSPYLHRSHSITIPTALNHNASTHYVDEEVAHMVECLLYSPIFATARVGGLWTHARRPKTSDFPLLIFYRDDGVLRFVIDGIAKMRGWCDYWKDQGVMMLHCTNNAWKEKKKMVYLSDGYWEEETGGGMGIVTPLFPSIFH